MTTVLLALLMGQAPTPPPKVGDRLPAFELTGLGGTNVRSGPLLKRGPLVLVVLRGYPGYQCPFCTRQVGDLVANAGDFQRRNASVLLVYPGPSKELSARAKEFVDGTALPANFVLALDPDLRFAEKLGLRWNAPGETAYPSTFVVGPDGRVAYAKVSRTHGDRASGRDVAEALRRLDRR